MIWAHEFSAASQAPQELGMIWTHEFNAPASRHRYRGRLLVASGIEVDTEIDAGYTRHTGLYGAVRVQVEPAVTG